MSGKEIKLTIRTPYQIAYDTLRVAGLNHHLAELGARLHMDKLAKENQHKTIEANVAEWQRHRKAQKEFHTFHRAFNTPYSSHVRA